jgi:RNA polymerase-interacting CarD/CdnL/TRCF family regulator
VDHPASSPSERSEHADKDPLAKAYEQRNMQLNDARIALAEVVSALTAELTARTQERDQGLQENRALRDRVEVLEHELLAAQGDIAALRGMKVVRWTARPRRLVNQIRARRR